MKVETVYSALLALGLVDSAYEFSVNYLGKKKNYFSVIKARNAEPSIEVKMTLVEALRLAANYIQAGDNDELKDMKSKLRFMSKEVQKEMEKRCRCNLWHYF